MKFTLLVIALVFLLPTFSCIRKNKQPDEQKKSALVTQLKAATDSAKSISEPSDSIQSVKDTLILQSPAFEINGIKSFWTYTVARESRPENPTYNTHIISMQLKSVENDRILLQPEISFDLMNELRNINELQREPQSVLSCKDINHDSWCDYELLFERAAGGSNTTTNAYLFNPANTKFELSKLFSGTNLEYDSSKNMIKTFWKMGYNMYTYTYTYLKPNKKEISYIIEENYDGDKCTVTKIVKGKVVKRTTKPVTE